MGESEAPFNPVLQLVGKSLHKAIDLGMLGGGADVPNPQPVQNLGPGGDNDLDACVSCYRFFSRVPNQHNQPVVKVAI
jgi:hypothetical protein